MAKRRGHREGTFIRTKDGRLRAAVTMIGPDGVALRTASGAPRRKWFDGKSRRQLTERIAAYREQERRASPLTDGRITLGEYLERWQTDTAGEVTAYTVRNRRYGCQHFIAQIGNVRLDDLRPGHIQMAILALAQTLSAVTVKAYLATLSAALTHAVNFQLIDRNPCDPVKTPRAEKPQRVTLTAEHALRLIDQAESDRLGALWVVFLTTGVRMGEALGLQWGDLDLDAGAITVRRQAKRVAVDGRATVTLTDEPKYGSGRRLPLTSWGVAALRAHRQVTLDAFPLTLVFRGVRGGPLNPAQVNVQWHRMLERLGLPHLRPHDARHTAATLLLEAGVPMRVVSELLGHTRIGITADLYTHVSAALNTEAIALLEARIERARAVP